MKRVFWGVTLFVAGVAAVIASWFLTARLGGDVALSGPSEIPEQAYATEVRGRAMQERQDLLLLRQEIGNAKNAKLKTLQALEGKDGYEDHLAQLVELEVLEMEVEVMIITLDALDIVEAIGPAEAPPPAPPTD